MGRDVPGLLFNKQMDNKLIFCPFNYLKITVFGRDFQFQYIISGINSQEDIWSDPASLYLFFLEININLFLKYKVYKQSHVLKCVMRSEKGSASICGYTWFVGTVD